jgi:hypothetical protein
LTVEQKREQKQKRKEKQKQMRVNLACELLPVLSVQNARQWHEVITLDESWVNLPSDHDLVWMTPGEIVSDRERHTIRSRKVMLTVVWNLSGFHVLKALPKGSKCRHNTIQTNILIEILDWKQLAGGMWPNKLCIHADNPRSHTAKVSIDFITLNQMKQALHPPYPRDLAPLDFFLSGDFKRKLMGYHAESLSELLVRIRVILSEISRERLNAVFLNWMERLQKYIDNNGQYVG